MFELNKILVVVNQESTNSCCIDRLLKLAKANDPEIILLSAEHTQYLVEGYYFDALDLEKMRADYVAERLEALELIAEPLRQQGLTVTTRAEWGYPGFDVIARQAKELCADLVIHQVAKHGAFSRLFLTHEDWQVIRCCPAPLLLVKGHSWHAPPRIVAAVDPMHSHSKPSGLDHKILNMALALGNYLNGEVASLHACTSMPFSGEYPKEALEKHKQAYATLMSEFDIPADRQHFYEEAPEFALQKIESDVGVDMIVMGAISRSFLADVFIGNTTEKVVDYLQSDILVVKPDDFITPE